MSNPLRLREMQERNGIKPKKDKKERKREKHEKKKEKHRRRDRSRTLTPGPDDRYVSRTDRRPLNERYSRSRRSFSPRDRSPPVHVRNDDRRYTSDRDYPRGRSRSRSRSRSPYLYNRRRDDSLARDHREDGRVRVWPRSSDESDDRERSRSPDRSTRKRRRSRSRDSSHGKRTRHSPPSRTRPIPTHSSRSSNGAKNAYNAADDRAARLAAMSSSASGLEVERQQRLAAIRAKEEAEFEAEEKARAKSKGMGGFLSNEQKKVYNGGLEDRIRRGRGGMVVDAD